LRELIARPLRLEAAVPVEGGRRYPKTIDGFHYTHQITPNVFELVRDDTNYTVPDHAWTPPELPRSLAERKRT